MKLFKKWVSKKELKAEVERLKWQIIRPNEQKNLIDYQERKVQKYSICGLFPECIPEEEIKRIMISRNADRLASFLNWEIKPSVNEFHGEKSVEYKVTINFMSN